MLSSESESIIILCLAITAVSGVVCAAVLATRTVFRCDTMSLKLLSAVVIIYALIVSAGLITGLCGLLTPASVYLMALVLSGALICGCRTMCAPLLTQMRHLSGTTVPARLAWIRGWSTTRALCAGPLAILASLCAVRSLTAALTSFPADWDTLMYHLPLIDLWLSTGNLVATACPRWSDPGNNELVGLFVVAACSGDFYISFMNTLSVIVLFAAAVEILSSWRLHPAVANSAALLILCNYVLVRQMIDAGNDVAVAAFYIAATAYGMRYLASPQNSYAVMHAISIGLLSGIKFAALPYALMLTASLVAMAFWMSFGDGRRVLVATVLGMLLFGAPWYVRNMLVSHTPFYPFGLTAATNDFLRTRPTGLLSTTLAGTWTSETLPLLGVAIVKQYGLVLFAGVALYPLAAFCGFVAPGKSPSQRNSRWLCVAASFIAWTMLFLTPFSAEMQPGSLDRLRHGYSPMRFGLPAIALSNVLALVLVMHVWRLLRHEQRRFQATATFGSSTKRATAQTVGVLGLLVCLQLTLMNQTKNPLADITTFALAIVIGIEFVGALMLGVQLARKFSFTRAGLTLLLYQPVLLAVMAVVAGSAALASVSITQIASARWHRGFDTFYSHLDGCAVYTWLTDYITEHPNVTICVCRMKYYPFFGSSRCRNIIRPGKCVDEREVMEYVNSHRCDLVVVWDDDPVLQFYKHAPAALDGLPGVFARAYVQRHCTVYQAASSASDTASARAIKNNRALEEITSPVPSGAIFSLPIGDSWAGM